MQGYVIACAAIIDDTIPCAKQHIRQSVHQTLLIKLLMSWLVAAQQLQSPHDRLLVTDCSSDTANDVYRWFVASCRDEC